MSRELVVLGVGFLIGVAFAFAALILVAQGFANLKAFEAVIRADERTRVTRAVCPDQENDPR